MPTFKLIVGTFNTPQLYTLQFDPTQTPSTRDGSVNGLTNGSTNGDHNPSNLSILELSSVIGSHSWLHLSPKEGDGRQFLYCTGWTEPPTLVAYEVTSPNSIKYINSVETAQRSGYVCANEKAVYSAGAAVGEVYAIDPRTGGFAGKNVYDQNHQHANGVVNGSGSIPNGINGHQTNGFIHQPPQKPTTKLGESPIQTVSFTDSTTKQRNNGSVMDFGGIRHGAHSADFSPSGRTLYVADIGRNCVWSYAVCPTDGTLSRRTKNAAPRANDGPRHAWPHPNGKVVYSLQEHTSMVDVFDCVDEDGLELSWVQGISVLPSGKNPDEYWADEVRTSLSLFHANTDSPRVLYASNRGLEAGTKGYVAAYALDEHGHIDKTAGEKGLLHMWETPTSGGWANAIQPAPKGTTGEDDTEYISLTDGEIGMVMILGFNGKTGRFSELARVRLDEGAGAATAVWL